MNILFVSAVLPYPLYSGGQVRIYNLLKTLSSRHVVTLYCFIRSLEERNHIPKLSFCNRIETVLRGHAWQPRYVISSIVGSYPLLLASYNNREMKRRLTQEIKTHSYDLIHLEPSYVWPSLPHTDVPTIITEHNIEHTIYEGYVHRFPFTPLRPFLFIDVLKLRWWERRIWQKAMYIIAVSDNDQMSIQHEAPHADVSVVSNGVDIEEFDFRPKKSIPMDALVFLFVGYFGWLQNRDALEFVLDTIWPSIKRRYEGAILRVAGRGISNDLRKKITKQEGTLFEHVTDIQKEFTNAHILLAPIRIGGGTKFKILEAMASGIAVITTSIGASGLNVRDRQELLVANTSEEFLKAIDILVKDTKLHTAMLLAARRRIEKSYSWDSIAKDLERVWEDAAKK